MSCCAPCVTCLPCASIDTSDISEAIDDMLFDGGRLNVRLLGGTQQMTRAAG